MTRRGMTIVLLAVGLTVSGVAPVWAQDPIHKAGRGIVNVLTGWIEIPKQVHLGRHDENTLLGLGRGLIRGAGLTVLRGGVGIFEALTFLVAYPKDFASPYEQMELPDYAWE